jgi:hypothetical protein
MMSAGGPREGGEGFELTPTTTAGTRRATGGAPLPVCVVSAGLHGGSVFRISITDSFLRTVGRPVKKSASSSSSSPGVDVSLGTKRREDDLVGVPCFTASVDALRG